MRDSMNPRLARWEIETIDALAAENYDQASRKQYVQHPERFVESFVVETQARCLSDARARKALVQQAERMGIGNVQPPRVSEIPTAEPYDAATNETAGRWVRITGLVFQLPFDHDWRLMLDEIVTRQVREERQTGVAWRPRSDAMGELELLEQEAIRMGLIEGEAPAVSGRAAVLAMTRAIAGVVA